VPTLVNDWDGTKHRPTIVWTATCTNCGTTGKSDTLPMPKGWEQAEVPNADGRFPARCPSCRKS